MARLCTWCNNQLGPEETSVQSGQRIARTVCSKCSENFVFQMGVPLQKMIDTLPAPIFVVDGAGIVKGANSMGYEYLQKRPDQVTNTLGGNVFDCAYAQLPEGCGRTVHCSGCAIRRSVYHTFETGESLIEIPATLRYGDPTAPGAIAMLISTEKMGNVVLLRIDLTAKSPAS